jgi:FRG domain
MLNFFEELNFENWNSLKEFFGTLDSDWCFRGQSDFNWRLNSSMDRVEITVNQLDNYKKEFEGHMIRDFKRNSQFYSDKQYLVETDFQIIAYMQHYGAPTRLLDFTESPYVASFFAIDNSKEFCSVYVINYMELLSSTRLLFATQRDDNSEEVNAYKYAGSMSAENVFDKLVLGNRQFAFVELVQPFYMFERIIQQQGLFLCQGDIKIDFESNLYANYLVASSNGHKPMYKIKIPNEWKMEIIKDLNRMNINHSTLFPGVEGYFKSVKNIFDISATDRLKHIDKSYLSSEKENGS